MFSSRKRSQEWLLTCPSLIWLLLFFLFPTLVVCVIAFLPHDVYGGIEEGWTLENVYSLFTPAALQLIWRTLWVSSIATSIIIVLATPVAFFLAQLRKRLQNLILLAIIIPFWTSFIVRIFAWKSILHPEGVVKQLLVTLHLISPKVSLLYNTSAVIFIMVYTYLPFAILPIYAAAAKFDFNLIEAAKDLGANRKQAFFKVFIPAISRGILNATIIVFIPILGTYVIPDMVGGPSNEMIGNRIGQKVLVARNLPEASAWAMLLTLGILIPTAIGIWLHKGRARRLDMVRVKE